MLRGTRLAHLSNDFPETVREIRKPQDVSGEKSDEGASLNLQDTVD